MNIVHISMNIITSLSFSLSTTMITTSIHIIDSRDFLLSFFFFYCASEIVRQKKEKKKKKNSFLSKIALFYVCLRSQPLPLQSDWRETGRQEYCQPHNNNLK